ncbi:hypothetical protein [Streptomyces sp. ODS28]|uniref:hypothetical protein n=1 Tax=Streptomyces sp. ODS28 TaxID=3136688 RepID=UPI0031E7EB42
MTVQDAATRLQVRYVLPPFFHEIPVGGDAEETGEALLAAARELMPGGDTDDWFAWILLTVSQLDALHEARAVYAGFCLLDMEGRNSTANVVITHTGLREPDAPEATAATFAAALRSAHPDASVHRMALPCGPAVAKVEGRTAPFPPETVEVAEAYAGERRHVRLGSIQVFVPLPNERELLTLEMTTPDMEDWDFYSRMFSDTVRSIECWEEPDGA